MPDQVYDGACVHHAALITNTMCVSTDLTSPGLQEGFINWSLGTNYLIFGEIRLSDFKFLFRDFRNHLIQSYNIEVKLGKIYPRCTGNQVF